MLSAYLVTSSESLRLQPQLNKAVSEFKKRIIITWPFETSDFVSEKLWPYPVVETAQVRMHDQQPVLSIVLLPTWHVPLDATETSDNLCNMRDIAC